MELSDLEDQYHDSLQPLQAQFELFQHHKHWICQHKKKHVCRHQSKCYFIKCFNLLLYQRTLSQPNSASVGSDLIMGRIPAHPPTETFKALAGNQGSLLSVCILILTQLKEERRTKFGSPSPRLGMMQFNLNSIRVSKSSKSIEPEPTPNQPKSIS